MSSLECLHRIQRRQMCVKFNVSTQNTQETNVCQLWCVYTGYRGEKMYVKFNVSTQDTEETNVCQIW